MHRNTWLLILILLSGFFLRLYGLGTESLWADEGISVRTVTASFDDMRQILSRAVHPPLHYLLLHPWTQLFGDSEFSVRLPSVLFSMITIWMSYRLGSILFDRTTGLLAALLVSLSLFNIRYAQEARNYSLLCMMGSISYYYYINMLRDSSRKASIGYVIASVLLMYTHVYGLFTIIAQNLHFLGRKLTLRQQETHPSWSIWLGVQALLLICFAPWVHILLHHVTRRQVSGAWQPTPTSEKLIGLFVIYAGTPLLSLLCGAITVAALYVLWRWGQRKSPNASALRLRLHSLDFLKKEPFYLLCIWMFSHNVLPFILSQMLTSFYRPRYTIVGSIAFYLLIAKALQLLSSRTWLINTAVASLCILTLAGLSPYYHQYNKERWRDVASYVDTFAQAGDLVVVNSGFLLHTNFNYYSKRTDLLKKDFPDPARHIRHLQPAHLQELSEFIANHPRVWMIFSHNQTIKQSLRDTVQQTHKLVELKQYHHISHVRQRKRIGVEVLLYERQEPRISHQHLPPNRTAHLSRPSSLQSPSQPHL